MTDRDKPSMRSPLGRAKGLGSSRSGVSHWWMQRLTAMGMVPLVLYCLISFLCQRDGGTVLDCPSL
jgi:succinate dehydrogenase / fumarate reductase membrane anchor subunit